MAANANSDDETNVVSMVDVLEEEKLLEDDATAVLGGSDDTNCTYPSGYVERQALYSCKTCTTPDTEPAAVCLACCLHCHDGHDLYELYTKRNFRCDCGNNKFKNFTCKLFQEKEGINEKNKYNHNFEGKYCTCNRPYPDPDDDVSDEMIQCVMCEDWYHSRHLDGDLPYGNYEEMVCGSCMESSSFLKNYAQVYAALTESRASESTTSEVSQSEDSSYVNVSSLTETDSSGSTSVSDAVSSDTTPGKRPVPESGEEIIGDHKKQKTDTCQSPSSQDAGSSVPIDQVCRLAQLRETYALSDKISAIFWKAGWRTKLCKCRNCQDMYRAELVEFLTDEADSISSYECRGKQKHSETQYEQGLRALGDMNRIQQVEVLQGFSDMKSQLTEYLKSFAENGKVVTQADIQEFFTRLSSKKKSGASGMQYHCK